MTNKIFLLGIADTKLFYENELAMKLLKHLKALKVIPSKEPIIL